MQSLAKGVKFSKNAINSETLGRRAAFSGSR